MKNICESFTNLGAFLSLTVLMIHFASDYYSIGSSLASSISSIELSDSKSWSSSGGTNYMVHSSSSLS